jgi:hypothetical protein
MKPRAGSGGQVRFDAHLCGDCNLGKPDPSSPIPFCRQTKEEQYGLLQTSRPSTTLRFGSTHNDLLLWRGVRVGVLPKCEMRPFQLAAIAAACSQSVQRLRFEQCNPVDFRKQLVQRNLLRAHESSLAVLAQQRAQFALSTRRDRCVREARQFCVAQRGKRFQSSARLSAYPNNPAARNAIKPQAKWRKLR